jgi:hypothetical protein
VWLRLESVWGVTPWVSSTLPSSESKPVRYWTRFESGGVGTLGFESSAFRMIDIIPTVRYAPVVQVEWEDATAIVKCYSKNGTLRWKYRFPAGVDFAIEMKS